MRARIVDNSHMSLLKVSGSGDNSNYVSVTITPVTSMDSAFGNTLLGDLWIRQGSINELHNGTKQEIT